MLVTISLLVSAVAAAYIYLVWNFNYWKKRHVPGPDPKPLVGNFPAFILRTRTVMEEMDEIYNNRSPRILITCPALAKDILTKYFRSFHDNEFGEFTESAGDAGLIGRSPFFLNGDKWKAKRAEITPAFTTSRMKALFPIVEFVSTSMSAYIVKNRNSELDARELAAKFTTDVVSSCIFDTDAQSFTNENAQIREMGRKLTNSSFTAFVTMMLLSTCPKLAKMLNIGSGVKKVEQFFIDLMSEAAMYREKNGTKRVDYLEHLISLRNEKQITEVDMAAHGVTNPTVQTRLREDCSKASNDQGTISYEDLLELPYLEQVINETLRLWPVGPFLSKTCTEPVDLELCPGQSVRIEPGVCAIIPFGGIHRDPQFYQDPLTFNPDRFSPETGGVNPYREMGCFMPFGEGPRQCLGMRFARMQMKRAIYEVVKNFELSGFFSEDLHGWWVGHVGISGRDAMIEKKVADNGRVNDEENDDDDDDDVEWLRI
ncbi:hypothetical protein quinque_016295 [Culex quinquefasciatus]